MGINKSILKTGSLLDDGKKIKTPIFRLSFPYVFKRHAYGQEEEKYSITMLFDLDEVDLSIMQSEVKKAIKEKFGKKGLKDKKIRKPFRKGRDKPELDGYDGNIKFAVAKGKFKPRIVNADLEEISEEQENEHEIYAGCYCRATVNVFAYDNKTKGVSFGLLALQKVKDGEPFGSSSDPMKDFDEGEEKPKKKKNK